MRNRVILGVTAIVLVLSLLVPVVGPIGVAAAEEPPPTPTNPRPGSISSPGPVLGDKTVTLEWDVSPGATHYMLFITNVNAGYIEVPGWTQHTSYTVTLQPDTPYSWTVRAHNAAGASPLTTPRYFQTPLKANLVLEAWAEDFAFFYYPSFIHFYVMNTGDIAADNVELSVMLDDSALFGYASDGGVYSISEHKVTWHLGSIAAGDYREVWLDLYYDLWYWPIHTAENHAIVSTTTPEYDYSDNEAITWTFVCPPVQFDLWKSAPATASPGSEITYMIEYFDHFEGCCGPSTDRVIIVDTLPDNVEFVSASDGGVYADGKVTWEFDYPMWPPYGEVTTVVKVADDAPIGSILRNEAEIWGPLYTYIPSDPYNNDVVFTTVVEDFSEVGHVILIEPLSLTHGPYTVGQTLTATFRIKNAGNAAITLDKLLLGGRYEGGELPWGGYPDFTYQTVTLDPDPDPEQTHLYHGTFTIPAPGDYHFFIAYYIEDPTEAEKQYLDEHNWNTYIDLGPGLTDADRTRDITATGAKVLPVPYYFQGGTDWCLPASMSMVFKYYNQNIHSWDIAKDWEWGTSMPLGKAKDLDDVRAYMEGRNLTAAEYKIWPVDFYTVRSFIDSGMPVVAQASWMDLEWPFYHIHAVVIVGYDRSGVDKVYIHDPSSALTRDKLGSTGGYPYATVEVNWADVSTLFDWILGVDGTPDPSMGTIDLYDKRGSAFETAHGEVNRWAYGYPYGLTWAKESTWEPVCLNPEDRFRVEENIINHLKVDQTYCVEVEFTRYDEQLSSWIPVNGMCFSVNARAGELARAMMDYTPLKHLLSGYGQYKISLRLWDETCTDQYDEILFPEIQYAAGLVYELESPANLYATDPHGLQVGFNPDTEEAINEILGAVYTGPSSKPQVISIPDPLDGDYMLDVIGTDQGDYSLTARSITLSKTMTFVASGIPVSNTSIHRFIIDWQALSEGFDGVTIQVDSDGDGEFDHTFTAGSELTGDQFILHTETFIDFDPNVLNLRGRGGGVVTVYIELPEGFDVSDIDISSIRLNGTVLALSQPTAIGDYNDNGIPDLMVKFDRRAVHETVDIGESVEITITGEVAGTSFMGVDTIRVIG